MNRVYFPQQHVQYKPARRTPGCVEGRASLAVCDHRSRGNYPRDERLGGLRCRPCPTTAWLCGRGPKISTDLKVGPGARPAQLYHCTVVRACSILLGFKEAQVVDLQQHALGSRCAQDQNIAGF